MTLAPIVRLTPIVKNVDVLAKDQPVVVYCASRSCTARPTLRLEARGSRLHRGHRFEGGIDEWEQAGYALQRWRAMATA